MIIMVKKFILIVYLQSFLASAQLFAKTRVKACGVHWPPHTIASKERLERGLSLEVHEELFKRMGMIFVAVALPWKRCITWTKKGVYDGIIDADQSLFKDFYFSSYPTNLNPVAVFVNSDFIGDKYNPSDLKGKVVLLPRGYVGYIKIANDNGWEINEVNSEKIILKMIDSKRYQYGLIDFASVGVLSKQLGVRVKHLKPIVMVQKLGFGFNFKNKDLLPKYNGALKSMIKDGTMDKLYKKYLPFAYTDILNK